MVAEAPGGLRQVAIWATSENSSFGISVNGRGNRSSLAWYKLPCHPPTFLH
jgi:hypothetical protein